MSEPREVILGSDEVGYGALAGPIFVCAAFLPVGWTFPELKDSKKFASHPTRERFLARFLPALEEAGGGYALEYATAEDIDLLGVARVLPLLHRDALRSAEQRLAGRLLSRVVVDGSLHIDFPGAESVPKADGNVPAVMAASVIAKVHRDRVMIAFAETYPQYSFNKNMGYGSSAHLAALVEFGPCPLHRRSYKRVESRDGQGPLPEPAT